MSSFGKIVRTASLATMAAAFATAGTLNLTCSVASGPTELGGSTSGLITCPGDGLPPSEITGISVTIDGAVIAPSDITLTNTNLQSEVASATTMSTFTLATALPGTSFGLGLFTVNASTGTLTLGPAGSSTASSTTAVAGSNMVQSAISPADFAFYENGFTFTGDTSTVLAASFGGGNGTATQVTDASLTATVQYTYSSPSTPEPASMALMGSALMGVGFLRKKLKK